MIEPSKEIANQYAFDVYDTNFKTLPEINCYVGSSKEW